MTKFDEADSITNIDEIAQSMKAIVDLLKERQALLSYPDPLDDEPEILDLWRTEQSGELDMLKEAINRHLDDVKIMVAIELKHDQDTKRTETSEHLDRRPRQQVPDA